MVSRTPLLYMPAPLLRDNFPRIGCLSGSRGARGRNSGSFRSIERRIVSYQAISQTPLRNSFSRCPDSLLLPACYPAATGKAAIRCARLAKSCRVR
jgi:hypothetical protein